MKHQDALNVFNLCKSATIDDIKLAYRKACSQYHPDRNPAGLEMMKVVNAAYDALQDHISVTGFDDSEESNDYGDEINNALNAIIHLGLNIEVCGSWLWVSGDTKPHKDVLKEAGFKWAPKKMMWHYRPSDYKSFNRGKWDMDKIRQTHGSTSVKNKSYTTIAA